MIHQATQPGVACGNRLAMAGLRDLVANGADEHRRAVVGWLRKIAVDQVGHGIDIGIEEDEPVGAARSGPPIARVVSGLTLARPKHPRRRRVTRGLGEPHWCVVDHGDGVARAQLQLAQPCLQLA